MMNKKNRSSNSGQSLIEVQGQASREVQPYYGEHYDVGDGEPELDLSSLWRIVLRHRKLILAVFCFSVITALISTMIMRPVYTASSYLELNTTGRNVVKFNKLETENLGQGRYLQTQLTILESRAIGAEVVRRLGLVNHPEYDGSISQRSLKSLVGLVLGVFSGPDDTGIKMSARTAENIYLSRLVIEPISRSDIIKISVNGFDPELAARIANEHIRAYVSLTSDRRFNSSSEAKGFIEKELDEVKARLTSSEMALTSFAKENNDIDIEDSDNIILARLSALNGSLSEVQSDRINAETSYLQAKSINYNRLSAVNSDPIIVLLKQEQSTLEAQYLEQLKLYKPKYPAMQELKAKIDQVQSSIDSQSSNVVAGIKSTFLQYKSREVELRKALQKVKDELFVLRDRAVEYNILKREWEADKLLFSGLLERSKELEVAAGIELNAGSLVEEAIAPRVASSPNLKFNLFIASILGLGGGLGIAFFLSLIDNRVNDVHSLEKLTGIPNLAVLPSIVEGSSHGDSNGNPQSSMGAMDLRALTNPGDIFGESLNSLRSSLKYVYDAEGVPAKVFAVTSSVAGEGKSLISTNLSVSYAKAGLKTLLIEGDLRRPRLAKVFDLEDSNGLVHSLNTGEAIKVKSLNDLSNLSIIFAGQISQNPVKELGSPSMQKLVAKCRQDYDVVIIDCPPILGLADTIEIAALVDAIVLVVGAHKAPRKSVEHSVQRLQLVGAPLVGTIFNQADPEISGYDHYAYAYYTAENT
jgi:succinoglycan biosynthesis transport protein ExoP